MQEKLQEKVVYMCHGGFLMKFIRKLRLVEAKHIAATGLLVVTAMWQGMSLAESTNFTLVKFIQNTSYKSGSREGLTDPVQIVMQDPQGGEIVGGKKVVLVAGRGGVIVFEFFGPGKGLLFDQALQLPESSSQKRRIVKSYDEHCLFTVGDGGLEGSVASYLTSLSWVGEKLVIEARRPFDGFGGISDLAVSHEGDYLATCSSKSGIVRVYALDGCSFSHRAEAFVEEGWEIEFYGAHSISFSKNARLCVVGGQRIGCFRLNNDGVGVLEWQSLITDERGHPAEAQDLLFFRGEMYVLMEGGSVAIYASPDPVASMGDRRAPAAVVYSN
ncbi:MAG: hypothetical protein ACPG5T_01835, partial [Endozoicomonas sp.]